MTAALDRLWAIADQPAPTVLPGQIAVPDGPAIGSLCTGYGGLDMAVQAVLGGHLAWVADPDPGAAAILARHHPNVPNLGDLTTVDWAAVEPVDIVCGGYPCQPFSVAGLRKGTADERHIWPHIATAIRVLRPRLCLFENVAGHIRLGLADVLADLARLGFDAEWTTLRASDVGAAHQRKRLWLAAWPAGSGGPGLAWWRAARAVADGGRHPSDALGVGRGEGRPEPAGQQGGSHAVGGRGAAHADADRGRLPGGPERHGEPQRTEGHHDDHEPDPHGRGVADADAADQRCQRGGATR